MRLGNYGNCDVWRRVRKLADDVNVMLTHKFPRRYRYRSYHNLLV